MLRLPRCQSCSTRRLCCPLRVKVIADLQSIAAGLRFWDKPEHAQGVLAFAFEGDARGTVVTLVGVALFRCWKRKFVEVEVFDISVTVVLAEGAGALIVSLLVSSHISMQ